MQQKKKSQKFTQQITNQHEKTTITMKQPVWTPKWLKNQQVRTRARSDDSDSKSTGTAQSASNATAKRGKCSQPKDHTYLNATI